jgi:hypothetical protein
LLKYQNKGKPEGTDARKRPPVVFTSTSTVGAPRLSITSRARTAVMVVDMARDAAFFNDVEREMDCIMAKSVFRKG